ncbi:GAK system CofD-like protein [Donghicola tyrosinivorans]|uniref:CofD-related protein of GAK system n=1 Tax=Donghicola tyrosinivorans TaxID=1652492 RepID=A0A2T0WJR8_9RHOB|nr:GAK system CofD-like protein [Donghicola tyrosinivorans]PRY86915.1 CofD-related protein of GAK system [Donghicola tyrosinivorans]
MTSRITALRPDPSILFFSGGSALNEIARALPSYTNNSAHILTPFDSGGSSRVLREAFGMPAVGDARSRLVALAERSETGQRAAHRLISYRLPKDAGADALRHEFGLMCQGVHPLTRDVSIRLWPQLVRPLRLIADHMPADLDLRGASVGNLMLTGLWLEHDCALQPALDALAEFLGVRGQVTVAADVNLHIGATLEDGRRVVGQRSLTGKEVRPLDCGLQHLFLHDGHHNVPAHEVRIPLRNRQLIGGARRIVYAPGSLFTSVIATLLPAGTGQAIAASSAPKIYTPSLGADPECLGLDLYGQVRALLDHLSKDASHAAPSDLVSHVLCDYSAPQEVLEQIARDFGIIIVRRALATPSGARYAPDAYLQNVLALGRRAHGPSLREVEFPEPVQSPLVRRARSG